MTALYKPYHVYALASCTALACRKDLAWQDAFDQALGRSENIPEFILLQNSRTAAGRRLWRRSGLSAIDDSACALRNSPFKKACQQNHPVFGVPDSSKMYIFSSLDLLVCDALDYYRIDRLPQHLPTYRGHRDGGWVRNSVIIRQRSTKKVRLRPCKRRITTSYILYHTYTLDLEYICTASMIISV